MSVLDNMKFMKYETKGKPETYFNEVIVFINTDLRIICEFVNYHIFVIFMLLIKKG